MSWRQIEGHDDVVERFRRALARGRLATTFLFVGPEGIGKRTFAEKLAEVLLCDRSDPARMEPCGQCENCRQMRAGIHPDVLRVDKPADKSFIPLDLLIGDKEHRMREGLCHDLALRPSVGNRRIAIVDDADYFNMEGANALLKTLEEPPEGAVLFLIGTSADKQLPTIRSRSQTIRFRPLDQATVASLLLRQTIADDAAHADQLAQYSEGSLTTAAEMADPTWWEFRTMLLGKLAAGAIEPLPLVELVQEYVKGTDKNPPAARARLRQVVSAASDLYRRLLRQLAGETGQRDSATSPALEQLAGRWRGEQEAALACVDRCLEALAAVDRNANQNTLIEAWLDDLARVTNTGRPLPESAPLSVAH